MGYHPKASSLSRDVSDASEGTASEDAEKHSRGKEHDPPGIWRDHWRLRDPGIREPGNKGMGINILLWCYRNEKLEKGKRKKEKGKRKKEIITGQDQENRRSEN